MMDVYLHCLQSTSTVDDVWLSLDWCLLSVEGLSLLIGSVYSVAVLGFFLPSVCLVT